MFRRTMMASAIAVVTARVVAPVKYPQGFSSAPEGGAAAVAGLMSRHRALRARFACSHDSIMAGTT
jgi:hypothetical protein